MAEVIYLFLKASVHGRFEPDFPGESLPEICQQIALNKPIGAKVMAIVIMPAATPGWSIVSNEKGIIAVLIGLLVPAFKKVNDGSSTDRSKINNLLAVGGRAGIHREHDFVFHQITWL